MKLGKTTLRVVSISALVWSLSLPAVAGDINFERWRDSCFLRDPSFERILGGYAEILKPGTWFLRKKSDAEAMVVVTWRGNGKIDKKLTDKDSVVESFVSSQKDPSLCQLVDENTRSYAPKNISDYYELDDCSGNVTFEQLSSAVTKIWDCLGKSVCPVSIDQTKQSVRFYLSVLQLQALHTLDPLFGKIFGRNPGDKHSLLPNESNKHSLGGSFPCQLGGRRDPHGPTQKSIDLKAFVALAQIEPRFIELPETKAKDRIGTLIEWLNNKDVEGLVIGEGFHNLSGSKKLIYKHLKELKENGVTTLFMEFVNYANSQSSLDANEENLNFIPPEVAAPLKENDQHYGIKESGFYALVKKAKELGIRVVGLEDDYSEKAGFTSLGSDGPERLAVLNYRAYEIIRAEKGKGKYIAFVGSGHAVKMNGVVGLPELMGVPGIIVIPDKSMHDIETPRYNVERFAEGVESKVHAVFYVKEK